MLAGELQLLFFYYKLKIFVPAKNFNYCKNVNITFLVSFKRLRKTLVVFIFFYGYFSKNHETFLEQLSNFFELRYCDKTYLKVDSSLIAKKDHEGRIYIYFFSLRLLPLCTSSFLFCPMQKKCFAENVRQVI